jgi:hypothetical protein
LHVDGRALARLLVRHRLQQIDRHVEVAFDGGLRRAVIERLDLFERIAHTRLLYRRKDRRKSSKGSVLSTSPAVAQARRATTTPHRVVLSAARE